MTWYADEILLPASPKAVEYLTRDPVLRPFSYWIKNLDAYEWYKPEHRHTLPENGLLVIRPVTSPDSHGASWHDTPVLDWASCERISHQGPSSVSLPKNLDHLPLDPLPPLSFRRFLGDLAVICEQPVLYYAGSTWGGSLEQEYCFAYTPAESLFITLPDELFRSEDAHANPEYEVESALQSGLSVIGADMPTGFFAPHVRSFPWDDHKL